MLSFDEKKVSAAGSVVGIVSVALFLGLIIYPNIVIYDNYMNQNSFAEFRDVGQYLKNNTRSDERIMTNEGPYINYFSEREIVGIPDSLESFGSMINSNPDISYIVLSLYEPMPSYTNNMSQVINFTNAVTVKIGDTPIVYILKVSR